MKVWILFSIANDYNQPDKAFEKLFWEKPTAEELGKELGYTKEAMEEIIDGKQVRLTGCYFWLECFEKNK